MITKRQLSEELDKCIKQDGYAIYIKADSAVMIKEWMEHAPGCDNCTHKDNQFSVCSGCEDGSEYETDTTAANCGECHRRYYCEESPDSCTYAKIAQAEPEPSLDEAMTLDEAITEIKHTADSIDACEKAWFAVKDNDVGKKMVITYRQIASWLRELKERRNNVHIYSKDARKGCKVEPQAESEDKCKNCKYSRNPDYTRCHDCKAESEGERWNL